MKNTSSDSKVVMPVSRRKFFGSAVVASGAVMLGSGIPTKAWAHDDQDHENEKRCSSPECNLPVPIPHVTPIPIPSATNPTEAHFFFPGAVEGVDAITGHEPSLIFNFKGFIGNADLDLTGTGKDLTTGETGAYSFHTDMRFMKGVFVGTDGTERRGSFVFV